MFTILLYHGIDSGEPWERRLDSTDREYVLSRERFEQHIDLLATRRIPVLSLDECVDRGDGARAPVVLTFDDGDRSCYTTAAPILEHHGFRGEFFVVSQWIDRPGFLTRENLRDLIRRGHRVHSHSRTHAKLSTLDTAAIEEEVAGSKSEIEAMIDGPIRYFSAPGGAYDQRVLDTARRAGYAGVLNSVEGYNDGRRSTFVLRRFTARAYTRIGTLASTCEWPRYTAARLAVKRGAIGAVRRVLGGSGYERLRRAAVRPGLALSRRPRDGGRP
jgi:peptidoglycan/xylan/chitin deacetylase (PgdA/CDA1 family)